MRQKINLISIKNEIKENLGLSIPLVSAQLIYACSGFIGTALVAHLGEDALAASVLVTMVWMTLCVFFFGILNAVSVLVSHQYGAKNYAAISKIMGQALLLGIFISICVVLVLCTMPFFLRFSAQPPAVLQLAQEYMRALLWTIPGLIILIVYEQFLAGVNRAKLVLRISIMIVPIEILLIYSLIFGKFGLPACGIAGIGYGFATTYSIVAIGLVLYLLKAKYYQQYAVFANVRKINVGLLKEFIRVGLPMGFMHLIEVSTFAIATFCVAQFGTALLAAHQIAFQFLSFIITLAFAMSQTVTVRVGHAVGRADKIGVMYATYVGMGLNLICALIIAAMFYFTPLFFLQLDIDIHDPNNALLIQNASMLLAISAVLLLLDNIRIIGFGALRGLKDTQFPMYTSLISFWVIGLSCAYFFSFILHLDGKGIWWGLTVGIASGAIIILVRMKYLLQRADLVKIMEMKS